MPRVIVLGEALVDLFAEPGRGLGPGTTFSTRFGGAPANVAVHAARLGAEVGFIGKVGRDGFGAALAAFMGELGVDLSCLRTDPAAPTMLALVGRPAPDHPEFVLYQGANAVLAAGDIDPGYFAGCRTMVFGSVTLAYPSGEAALHAARLARDRGAEVVFDVNVRPTIWADAEAARERIGEALRLATVVKLSEAEGRFLFGAIGDEEVSRRIVGMGARLCCVTRGAAGTHLRCGSWSGFVPSVAVDTVDATGAGDAFVAALATEMAALGRPVGSLDREVLCGIVAFANACGAFVATRLGAMEAPL
ncbi:MAG: carbohydrate kinase, partial [Gluconacetobacter diazotrophicus]|nr:carbohydrate kinase [Gluconacetobacter diazotrophicus]